MMFAFLTAAQDLSLDPLTRCCDRRASTCAVARDLLLSVAFRARRAMCAHLMFVHSAA